MVAPVRPRTPNRAKSPHQYESSIPSPASGRYFSPRGPPQSPEQMDNSSPLVNDSGIPELLDLIERQQFDLVIARIKRDPSEASVILASASAGAHNSVMNQGNLALHEACKNQPPLDVIEALLDANEEAIKTKGQWGYLPLHFACCSRASPEVVAKLIVSYPSATRAKDDHEGTLPLHLAAKWGANDEVIMALLTVHPKASGVRDASGRTPIDHAKNLKSPHVRDSVMTALHRAPILCAVSKAAMNKLAHESDAKLREVVEVYQERMTQVKERYEQDKTTAVALEVQLRKELWDEKERSSVLSEKVAMLSHALDMKSRELDEKNQLLSQIQALIGSQLEESFHRQQQFDRKDTERKELAKTAVREWVSTGSSVQTNEQSIAEEERDPPPTRRCPSPKSAAVATVKEWFSSETSQFTDHQNGGEEIRRSGAQASGPNRDKVENYRKQNITRPNAGQASIRNQNPRYTNDTREKNQHPSLLNRSKSAPRQSQVLARRETSSRQIPGGADSKSSGNIRQTHPALANGTGEPPNLIQEKNNPYRGSQSQSYSTSSRRSQNNQGNPGWRQSYSHSGSSAQRRNDSSDHSPTRPRETYSTSKPATTAYSQRTYHDDEDESLTMDSNMVECWE